MIYLYIWYIHIYGIYIWYIYDIYIYDIYIHDIYIWYIYMIYIYMIYIYDIYIYMIWYIYIWCIYYIYMWCHVYIWYVMGGLFERGIPVLGGMEWHGKSWWTIGFGASQFGYNPISTGLVWGKICRKPWFLPSNIGLSCKFSHNPILWAMERSAMLLKTVCKPSISIRAIDFYTMANALWMS